MVRKLLIGFVVLVAVAAGGLAILVASRQNLRFDSTTYPAINASSDSTVLARGRYVVRALASCAGCHGDTTRFDQYMAGEDVPLSGGRVFDIPPGRFMVPNITPDSATGIGRLSDQAIARALRYNVGHDGRALLPFMEKQGLSDDDLVAVVSYLRTQAPVRNPVPAHEFSLLGKIIKATVLADPVGPAEPPPPTSPRGPTLENGRYLTESAIGCGGCHTQRDQRTGQFTGPKLAGGSGMVDEKNAKRLWWPPNITGGGMIGHLTEDAFVTRFRSGPLLPGSPMPWQEFRRIEEDDLRAIYRYLKSVPAATTPAKPPFEDQP